MAPFQSQPIRKSPPLEVSSPEVFPLFTFSPNENGGISPANGHCFPIEQKARVAQVYVHLGNQLGSKDCVSQSLLARTANVSRKFAKKIMEEVNQFGVVVDPNGLKRHARAKRTTGAGAESLDSVDKMILLELRQTNPSRTLQSYQNELWQRTGTVVDRSTICLWFKNAGLYKGNLFKTSKIPFDKFTDENLHRTMEYIHFVSLLDHRRLKFCDEKHLRGVDLFTHKNRRCPLTGIVVPTLVPSNYRNAEIQQETNDAVSFSMSVENAVREGFFFAWRYTCA